MATPTEQPGGGHKRAADGPADTRAEAKRQLRSPAASCAGSWGSDSGTAALCQQQAEAMEVEEGGEVTSPPPGRRVVRAVRRASSG
jgi:hypothetical protein